MRMKFKLQNISCSKKSHNTRKTSIKCTYIYSQVSLLVLHLGLVLKNLFHLDFMLYMIEQVLKIQYINILETQLLMTWQWMNFFLILMNIIIIFLDFTAMHLLKLMKGVIEFQFILQQRHLRQLQYTSTLN